MGTPATEHQGAAGRSSDWPVVAGWFCIGLYSLLIVHRFPLAGMQLAVAVAYASDEILSRKAVSRLRLNLIRGLAAAVLLATIWVSVAR
jgi:hypothetical protein